MEFVSPELLREAAHRRDDGYKKRTQESQEAKIRGGEIRRGVGRRLVGNCESDVRHACQETPSYWNATTPQLAFAELVFYVRSETKPHSWPHEHRITQV